MDRADELLKLKALVKAQDLTTRQLRSELARKDGQIRDLQIQLAAARRKVMLGGVADQRAETESLRKAVESAGARLRAIEHSFSWRITMPLREIAKTFR